MPSHGRGRAAELVGLGSAAAAVGGAYKLGEFLFHAKKLRDVGPANAVYVRLINRVRADLDEVKRLLAVPEVKKALEANPPKAKWIYGAMRDVRGALENITPLTERVGSDLEDGRRVGLRHRFYWLLSEKEKLENREKELTVAHASLTEVIGFLTGIEPTDDTEKGHVRHTHNTRTDMDVRRDRHDIVEERDVYVERERDPRRVTVERDVYVERDRDDRHGPVHYERDEYYDDRHAGPRSVHVEEHVHHDSRNQRHVGDEYQERGPGYYQEQRFEEHTRDPRDARHFDGQHERGPAQYDERRFEERRYDTRGPPPPRRESFDDRMPERDSYMSRRLQNYGPSPYDDYAEYGQPPHQQQPLGVANHGLPPLHPGDHYEREVWVEEREDFDTDKYGNVLPRPEHLRPTRYPRYPPRMGSL